MLKLRDGLKYSDQPNEMTDFKTSMTTAGLGKFLSH